MPLQVIDQQNLCVCTMGSLPTPIVVTSNQTVYCSDELAATIMDHVSLVNIQPFGTCTTLTAAAAGVPTPCLPATPAPWVTGSPTNAIQSFPNLRDCDVLVCMVGGLISVQYAGQTPVDVD